jgi:hypothetical protein
MNFLIGVVVGIVVATIGFSGVAKIADRGVEAIKHEAKSIAK